MTLPLLGCRRTRCSSAWAAARARRRWLQARPHGFSAHSSSPCNADDWLTGGVGTAELPKRQQAQARAVPLQPYSGAAAPPKQAPLAAPLAAPPQKQLFSAAAAGAPGQGAHLLCSGHLLAQGALRLTP